MLMLRAPAKVNLFLEVLGKRKDGYHDLNTLFLKLNFFDRLYFSRIKKGIEISCRDSRVPKDSTNLVYKAASLIQDSCGLKQGVHIRIVKKIPIAAGLGGGSSNAATTLLGLNKLWNLRLSRQTIFKLGKKLGADVPFFLIPDAAAWAKGKGDRLTPLNLMSRFWVVLVDPGIAVSTAKIFNGLSLDLTNKKNDVKLLNQALKKADIKTIGRCLFNRLESVTFKKYKCLAKIKKMMSALGVRAVLMSGSGSVIFGIVESREEAMRIKSKLLDKGEVIVVRSL